MSTTADADGLKRREAASFASVAPRYSALAERVTGPLAARFVAWAGVNENEVVVDVGTGTGVVARRAAAAGARVVGIDISPAMLHQARTAAFPSRDDGDSSPAPKQHAGLPESSARRPTRCHWALGDAERLPLGRASVDRGLSLFALTHVPDRVAAAAELHRVVRPGGGIAVAVGSGPPRFSTAFWGRAVAAIPEAVAATAGRRLVAPDALQSLLGPAARTSASPAAAGTGEAATVWLPRLLRTVGFRRMQRAWMREVVGCESVGDFWALHTTFSTPVRDWLLAASDDEIGRVREEFTDLCEPVLARGGRLLYPFAAFMVRALRA